ncbi:hypothetical protein MKZ38_009118 [Zalerion maritima]|uniref:Uncharacterized protein n=1 Tax=Zalerion maritima TaxID=339359 RepID=A0AAD5RGT4_9PEZI|nr:hypothetical protein MKZ38_009118 [Zalerion maritima]
MAKVGKFKVFCKKVAGKLRRGGGGDGGNSHSHTPRDDRQHHSGTGSTLRRFFHSFGHRHYQDSVTAVAHQDEPTVEASPDRANAPGSSKLEAEKLPKMFSHTLEMQKTHGSTLRKVGRQHPFPQDVADLASDGSSSNGDSSSSHSVSSDNQTVVRPDFADVPSVVGLDEESEGFSLGDEMSSHSVSRSMQGSDDSFFSGLPSRPLANNPSPVRAGTKHDINDGSGDEAG